ncbi:hypothetical protein AYO21_11370 [Fonsecaea monophora]|uniref:NTF2-like domain-containing protein n=1 Tax=Fonsecaea monophora TaxID=254056 RepID=A0A177ESN7_9EURO|nr:hypothetical protein AYO21_11370 [Fonsecaea monophora]OAG34461.1 hypothetical protein AYO21_11370 [Fonsecaea monophora]
MRFTDIAVLSLAATVLGQGPGQGGRGDGPNGVGRPGPGPEQGPAGEGPRHHPRANRPRFVPGRGRNTQGNPPLNSGTVGGHCLNDADVDVLVKGYTYLLQYPGGDDFNATANAILSDKFEVWSDSINTLGQRDFSSAAYPSLEAFIASQSVTPPLPTVETLSTAYTCDQIFWRWNAYGIGSDYMRVHGFIEFDVDVSKVQIDTVYSEFNTAAFWVDLGNPECQPSARK